jgi:hypothetical protein
MVEEKLKTFLQQFIKHLKNNIYYVISMSATILRNIARGRCCSFCYQQGHRIDNCNDQRIADFETLCQQKKLEFEEEFYQINEPEHTAINFRIWLAIQSNLNTSIYKAFAISRCGATLSDNQHVMLDKIIDYFNAPPFVDLNEYEDLPDLIDEENNVVPRQFPLVRGLGNLDFVPFENGFINTNTFNWDSRYVNQNLKELDIKTKVLEEEVTPENIDKNLHTKCECAICYDTKDYYEFVVLPCSHEFCNKCVIDTMEMCKTSNKAPFCGFCRAPFNLIQTRSEEIKTLIDNWLDPIITRQLENIDGPNPELLAGEEEQLELARREELNEYYISHRPERYF